MRGGLQPYVGGLQPYLELAGEARQAELGRPAHRGRRREQGQQRWLGLGLDAGLGLALGLANPNPSPTPNPITGRDVAVGEEDAPRRARAPRGHLLVRVRVRASYP